MAAVPCGDAKTEGGSSPVTGATTKGFNCTFEVGITHCTAKLITMISSSGTLGSPSKIRPTSVIASKNTRKRMEDRHVVLHDLKAYLPSNLQSKVGKGKIKKKM